MGAYIDDLTTAAVIPFTSPSTSASPAEVRARLADSAYEKKRVRRSVRKDVSDASCSRIWGPELNGDSGDFGIPLSNRFLVAALTGLYV